VDSEKESLQGYMTEFLFISLLIIPSGTTINANALYTAGELGLNLSGMGMIAGVWDGGKVRSTHQEFNNDRNSIR
jgi:hypothetical protein